MRIPIGRVVALLGSGMLLLASCGDEWEFLGPQTPEGCVSGGRSYTGEVAGGTWTRSASPHVLEDSVVVTDSLEIEPGALVCGMPGSSLTANLVAVGTTDVPIVFTAADPGGWNGLRGSGTLRHARIENTVVAILGVLMVEDSHIIRTSSTAVIGADTVRNVVIDNACTGGGDFCAAVATPGYASTVLEDVTIRNSGGMGIYVGRRSGLRINDVTIEGSAGVGLFVLFEIAGSGSLTMTGPVRITGGQSYPAEVHGSAAAQLLSDPANDLTGNALDTLVIVGVGLGDGPHVIRKDLPWHVRTCHPFYYTDMNRFGTITVQAGASLTVERVNADCVWDIDLRAEGTAAEPAIIRGDGVQMHSRVVSADTARLRHAILHDVMIRADAAPIVFEDIRTIDASLELAAAGSRIDGLHSTGSFERPWITTDPDAPAAVTLGAGTSMQRAHIEQARRDGVFVNGAGVSISGCTSTGNVRHGIRVTDGAPVIRNCNLFANAGMGVSNAATGSVDAVDNWWGDAGGPLGPSGDGFEGDVQVVPFLTAPAPFACGPECTSPGADSGFVLQGVPHR